MTNIYFDETGYHAPSFNEILEVIQEDQKQNVSLPLTYQDSKVIHQLNSVVARIADLAFQGLGAALDTLNIGNAEGRHLEELARLRGVYRIPAGRSNTSTQTALLKPATVIPAGTLFYSSVNGIEAYNPTIVTASASSCYEAFLSTNSTIVVGAEYGFNINGTNYTYVAIIGDTVTDIHAELSALLDADTGKTFTYTDVVVGANRVFTFTANTGTLLSVSSLTTKMTITTVSVQFYVECVETGPIFVDIDFMDSIRSPISGFLNTGNKEAYRLGRDEETDSELRTRAQAGPLSSGTGTIPTIEQALLVNVPNVTYARVIENTNVAPVDTDGRPLHSIEILVDGGFDEQELADEIWRVKGGGIELHGDETAIVIDSGGVERIIKYSLPTAINLDVEVDYERYTEETIPVTAITTMQEAIITYINSLPIGKDVIASRIFPVIYAALPEGVGRIVVRIQNQASLGFTENKVPISSTQYANVMLADITVTDVTPP